MTESTTTNAAQLNAEQTKHESAEKEQQAIVEKITACFDDLKIPLRKVGQEILSHGTMDIGAQVKAAGIPAGLVDNAIRAAKGEALQSIPKSEMLNAMNCVSGVMSRPDRLKLQDLRAAQ